MRRTRLYQILICLLCLFPVWSLAQSLTQYEYWIDDNFSARKSAGLSGYEADIDVAIDASRLGNGLHKLCFRVQQSDGMYSPVTTHYFFKAQVSNGGKLEYWFDGNRKKINTVDCHVSSDGEAYLYTSGLDLTAVTPGYHTMFYRFTNDDGTTSSAVSVASVFVTSNLSNGGKLEYWFDDDRENVNMVDGKVASTGDALIFNSALDLKDVSQGMHRMYYRLVDAKGKPNSAVSMTPVMVKSKYSIDGAGAQMTKYSIAVDDEEPAQFSFHQTGNLVDLDHPLDVRHLSKGDHKLNLKLANSVGNNVSLQQTFTVKEQPSKPVITLTATEKDGLVYIRFNSIASDNGYRIYRIDANGSSDVIKNSNYGTYPLDICFTDVPSAGTYTYYAKSLYTGIDGKSDYAKSNEVRVTVSPNHPDLGYIEGEIYYEGKRKVGFKSNISFTYNDFVVQSNVDGVFRMDRIPVGEVVSVMLTENDYYTSNIATVTIVKGKNYVRLKAIPKNDCTLNKHIDYGNLVFDDKLTWEPGAYFKLNLRNTSHEVWNGKICIKAIPKRLDIMEEPITPYEDIQIGQDAQILAGSIASISSKLPFVQVKNFQTFESENFQLVYNKAKEIIVPLTGFSNNGPKELFNFYVYCVKPNGSMSLVLPNNSYASTQHNPLEYEIEGGSVDSNYKKCYFSNLIVYFCTTVKELDKIFLGGASKVLNYGEKRLKDDYYMLTHATEEKVLADEGMQEVVYDMIKKCDEYSSEVKSFRDAISTIIKPYETWESVKKNIETIKKCSDDISSMNDYEKAIYLSQKIIGLANSTVPISSVMKTYLDITKKTIDNVLNLGWAYNEPNIPQDMYDNKLKVKIHVKGGRDLLTLSNTYSYIIDKVLVKGWNKTEKDIVEATFRNVKGSILDYQTAVFEQEGTDDRSKLMIEKPFTQLWAEIYWTNGRVTCVPLAEVGKGVTYEHAEKSNSIFTIHFVSEAEDSNHPADIIHLAE